MKTDTKTQRRRIAAFLRRFGWIDTHKAYEVARTMRAAARIYELRTIYGWRIDTVYDERSGFYRYELVLAPEGTIEEIA